MAEFKLDWGARPDPEQGRGMLVRAHRLQGHVGPVEPAAGDLLQVVEQVPALLQARDPVNVVVEQPVRHVQGEADGDAEPELAGLGADLVGDLAVGVGLRAGGAQQLLGELARDRGRLEGEPRREAAEERAEPGADLGGRSLAAVPAGSPPCPGPWGFG